MNDQRRQAAIEAGARALRAAAATALSDPSWDEIDEPLRSNYRMRAAAVIDAAAPHLAGDPVGYLVQVPPFAALTDDEAYRTLKAAQDDARQNDGRVLALVPVDEP